MQLTILCLVLLLSVVVAYIPFPGLRGMFYENLPIYRGGVSGGAAAAPAAPAPKGKAGAAKVPVMSKFKKDTTWGGRPDPTPEMIVDESSGGWLSGGWRYGRK
jgi:hypothetical protein